MTNVCRGSGRVARHEQLKRAHRKNPKACSDESWNEQVNKEFVKEVMKGVWGMPRLSEAKKDVISCDKLRGSANRNYIRRFPNGVTQCTEGALSIVRWKQTQGTETSKYLEEEKTI